MGLDGRLSLVPTTYDEGDRASFSAETKIHLNLLAISFVLYVKVPE